MSPNAQSLHPLLPAAHRKRIAGAFLLRDTRRSIQHGRSYSGLRRTLDAWRSHWQYVAEREEVIPTNNFRIVVRLYLVPLGPRASSVLVTESPQHLPDLLQSPGGCDFAEGLTACPLHWGSNLSKFFTQLLSLSLSLRPMRKEGLPWPFDSL